MQVYLDHAASAPLAPAASQAMIPWLTERFGNPSGAHAIARAARAAVDEARDQVATMLGVDPIEVVFTSGGTEADNLAVLGVGRRASGPIVISAVEHPAVTEAAYASGREVRVAAVGSDGVVDIEGLRAILDPEVSLVSIQLANNETGVLQPLEAISRRVRKWAPGAVIHTDAVQAAPWLDLPALTGAADLITISGHKLGGPQGVGALGVRHGVDLAPVLHGGGQERELRSGTHNVAAIVGLGAAAVALAEGRAETAARVVALRDRLYGLIFSTVPGCVQTAGDAPRLPGHLHVRFGDVESEDLLILLDDAGVCASAGSACASGAMHTSPILLAMGVEKQDARSSLRLTLGPSTTDDQIDYAGAQVVAAVERLRGA